MRFCLWSWEHNAWWLPAGRGYTRDITEAGRFSFDGAANAVIGHTPAGEEVAVQEVEALRNPKGPRMFPAPDR